MHTLARGLSRIPAQGFASLIVIGLVVLALAAIGAGWYGTRQATLPTHTDAVATSTSNATATTAPNNQTTTAPSSAAGPSVAIDQSSLTSASGNPTISGTALVSGDINVQIKSVGGTELAGSADTSVQAGARWSVSFVDGPYFRTLPPGSYPLNVFGPNNTETSATLTVAGATKTQTYTNAQYGFSFEYPPDALLATSAFASKPFAIDPVVSVQLRTDQVQTEGYLTVTVESGPGECLGGPVGTPQVTIGGMTFNKFDESRYEAGVSAEGIMREYKTVHNGYCYDIALTSFPSACVNSGCTDPRWSAATEAVLLGKLDQIAQSFRFTN
ncbi:MAG: hypothetical protein KGI78_03465 [Patescibacteria group bacterium]|nr:hypothetical protein [Patescibacteria group bacterium]MDE1945092.1 hypothetical protein [Patescibacteria group bacterium]MDE2057886.1 hypothetical protein [Patescibacteria group bacterium]